MHMYIYIYMCTCVYVYKYIYTYICIRYIEALRKRTSRDLLMASSGSTANRPTRSAPG